MADCLWGRRVAGWTTTAVLSLLTVGCTARDPEDAHAGCAPNGRIAVAFRAVSAGPAPAISVFSVDQSTVSPPAGAPLSVEARLLVLSPDAGEPELEAIRAALDHRGTPYDVFITESEPPLSAARLASGDRGLYQGIILASSSLAEGDASTLSAAEWAVLANYEARFRVRRAVLAAWPDPKLGFGTATSTSIQSTALAVTCTSAGAATFRDVACAQSQELRGGSAYRARALAGVTPLLVDGSGNALAATRVGPDGRESLLLMFRQSSSWLHSLVFAQGIVGWVAGGTYLGERQITLTAQLDDFFLASSLYGGGTYRLTAADLRAGQAWLQRRRSGAVTPQMRIAWAFNAALASPTDPLTIEAELQHDDWHWMSHTYSHLGLDAVDYATALWQLDRNRQAAASLGFTNFDSEDLVTPNVSGLVNTEAMRAAVDVGIRSAVTDTSRTGCNNPSPNTTFYDALAPQILLIPRRPTNLFYNVSTPAQWTAEYNQLYRASWGRDSTYAQIIDQESDVLLVYLLRGELDPSMFHQANLRAYDGVHSLLGDLLDATLSKLARRLDLEVRTPRSDAISQRFRNRLATDAGGVRATLLRGQALLLDSAAAATVAITGLRDADGGDYGGERIGTVTVLPGTTTCVPLDAAGLGCSPAPTRLGGPGTARALPLGICNASSLPQPDAGVVVLPVDAGLPVDAARPVDAAPVVVIDAAAVLLPDAAVVLPHDAAISLPIDAALVSEPDAAMADATVALPLDAADLRWGAPVSTPESRLGLAPTPSPSPAPDAGTISPPELAGGCSTMSGHKARSTLPALALGLLLLFRLLTRPRP